MKKTAKILGLLLIFQITGYFLSGLKHIHREICIDPPMWIDKSTIRHLGIYTESWVSFEEKIIIESMLKPKFGIIDFVEDKDFYRDSYRINSERYALSYEINHFLPFIAIVKEKNGRLEYGEDWEVWFAWIFIKWVEIRRIPRGQS